MRGNSTPGLTGALCRENLVLLKHLIVSAGPAFADAQAAASALGVHSVRLVQKSLELWRQRLSAKEKNLLLRYSKGGAEPDHTDNFPKIYLTSQTRVAPS